MNDLRSWLLQLAADTLAQEGGADVAHDTDHIARTMALAETLHANEGGDLPTIWAAVALHDVGRERERKYGGDHAAIGADMAGELLNDTCFPQQAIAAVQHAIREHRKTGTMLPHTIESRIVHDADKLDLLGAVGVARLYCVTGQRRQKIYTPLPDNIVKPVAPTLIRELRQRLDYSSTLEFELLFDELPKRLTTTTGRRLARERYEYMRDFFTRLHLEVEGQL